MQESEIIQDVRNNMSLLMIDFPFTMPFIKLDIKIAPLRNKAVATDGFNLYVDPAIWVPYDKPTKLCSLFHEWLHIAYLHSKRIDNRDLRIWTAACDFANNFIIKSCATNRFKFPEGYFYDPAYDNIEAEKIYEDLKKRKEQAKQNKNQLKPKFPKDGAAKGSISADEAADLLAKDTASGNMMDDLMQAPIDASVSELRQEIIKAAEAHKKMIGNLPGYYERLIVELRKAKAPWEQIFHTILKEVLFFGSERSFAHPKKWAWLYGIALPGESSRRKPNIVVIYDTSCSIQEQELKKFNGELEKAIEFAEYCTIITCDAKVHEKVKIRKISEIFKDGKVKFRGGGGTDFRPALIEAAKIKPDLTIYFTDGMGKFGQKIPGLNKLLWVLTNDHVKPPFGKYLVID